MVPRALCFFVVVAWSALVTWGAEADAAAAGFQLRLQTANTTAPPLRNPVELPAGEVHSWSLNGTSACRGVVVVELWEDPATANEATPLVQGNLLCPVVTRQSYELLQQDAALEQQFQRWRAEVHSTARQWDNWASASSNELLHWDWVACARQLPYHWILLDVAPATVQAASWWLLVVNNRNTSVPEYRVRATCAGAPVTDYCPQPNPEGARCSGAGTCVKGGLSQVTAPRCACRAGRTGIGCESAVQELKLGGKPLHLLRSLNPNQQLVASSTLLPWSLVQLQVDFSGKRGSTAGDQRVDIVELELKMDWSAIGTVQDANSLARPQLCFSNVSQVNTRPEPAYMSCHTPCNFPLGYQAGATIIVSDLVPFYKGALYILVMDVGTAPVTLAAREETRLESKLYTDEISCPFNCSGVADGCSLSGRCNCNVLYTSSSYNTRRDGDFCQYYTDFGLQGDGSQARSVIVDIKAGQRSWLVLYGASPADFSLDATTIYGKPWAADVMTRVLVSGHWVANASAGCTSDSASPLGMTGTIKQASEYPRVLCVMKETTLAEFTPSCSPKLKRPPNGHSPDLVFMLRVAEGGIVNVPSPMRLVVLPKRLNNKWKSFTKAELAIVVVLGFTLLAALALWVCVCWMRRQAPWRQGQQGQQGEVTRASRRSNRGLPAHVIQGYPIVIFCPPVADRLTKHDLHGGIVEMVHPAAQPGNAAACDTSSASPGTATHQHSSSNPTHTDQPDGVPLAPPGNPGDVGNAASCGSGQAGERSLPGLAPVLQLKAASGPGVDGHGDDRITLDRVASMNRVGSSGRPACAICLGAYQPGDRLRCLPCLHSFHCGCVDQWLASRGTCPTCRLDLARQPAGAGVQRQPEL